MQLSDSESCFFPCLFSEQHMSEQAWWCSTIVCLSTTVNSCKSRWSFEIWMSGYYKQHMSAICTLCLIVDLAGLIWNLVLSWAILSARWYWSTDPKPKALHCFVWFWLEGFWWECRWITDNRYNTIGDGYLLCDRKSPHIYIYIHYLIWSALFQLIFALDENQTSIKLSYIIAITNNINCSYCGLQL